MKHKFFLAMALFISGILAACQTSNIESSCSAQVTPNVLSYNSSEKGVLLSEVQVSKMCEVKTPTDLNINIQLLDKFGNPVDQKYIESAFTIEKHSEKPNFFKLSANLNQFSLKSGRYTGSISSRNNNAPLASFAVAYSNSLSAGWCDGDFVPNAIPNDALDDSNAIQAKIDSMNQTTQKTLCFDAGVYLINSRNLIIFQSNFSLLGNGAVFLFENQDIYNSKKLHIRPINDERDDAIYLNDIIIQGITFDNVGIKAHKINNLIINNTHFLDRYSTADGGNENYQISLARTFASTIKNSFFSRNAVVGRSVSIWRSQNILIENNYWFGKFKGALELAGNSATRINRDINNEPISLTPTTLRCPVESPSEVLSDIYIMKNTIKRTTTSDEPDTNFDHGIYIWGLENNLLIKENIISGWRANEAGGSIKLRDSVGKVSNSGLKSIQILDNKLYNSGIYLYTYNYLKYHLKNVLIQYNTIDMRQDLLVRTPSSADFYPRRYAGISYWKDFTGLNVKSEANEADLPYCDIDDSLGEEGISILDNDILSSPRIITQAFNSNTSYKDEPDISITYRLPKRDLIPTVSNAEIEVKRNQIRDMTRSVGVQCDTSINSNVSSVDLVTPIACDETGEGLLATGEAHTCALNASGAAFCWGSGEFGRLGNGEATGNFGSPQPVSGGLQFSSITAGYAHTCALTIEGIAYCWGNGASGQLGNNQNAGNSNVPTRVKDSSGLDSSLRFANIVAGSDHTCGITRNGSAFCWGRGAEGQLGSKLETDPPDTGTRLVPSPVLDTSNIPNPLRFATITAGAIHTCGLTIDNNVLCWGRGDYGRLGNNSVLQSNRPVSVVPMTPTDPPIRFSSLSAGGSHTCAISMFGEAYCWGGNATGQLGANIADQTKPNRVSANNTAYPKAAQLRFFSLSTKTDHTCAITTPELELLNVVPPSNPPPGTLSDETQNRLYCWGNNSSGQLGTKDFISQNTPKKVSDVKFSTVKSGGSHTCAMTVSRQVYCWGKGENGQIGNNQFGNLNAPTIVTNFTY